MECALVRTNGPEKNVHVQKKKRVKDVQVTVVARHVVAEEPVNVENATAITARFQMD